jgi:hypothetical protein
MARIEMPNIRPDRYAGVRVVPVESLRDLRRLMVSILWMQALFLVLQVVVVAKLSRM